MYPIKVTKLLTLYVFRGGGPSPGTEPPYRAVIAHMIKAMSVMMKAATAG